MSLSVFLKKTVVMYRSALFFRVAGSLVALVFAGCFYIYPAAIAFKAATDPQFIQTELSDYFLKSFNRVSTRYEKWAARYLQAEHALRVSESSVAATEWPMFGSTFYLLAAEEIKNQIAGRDDPLAQVTKQKLMQGSESAARVIADPVSAHWVKQKWGPDYFKKENVFYRMLFMMSLSSYENITGKSTYRELLKEQVDSFGDELMAAPHPLLDDYPGECWPSDVLWSAAAIRRADKILGTDHSALAAKLMTTLDTKAASEYGLPAFKIDARTLEIIIPPRGSGNSGILLFASELDKNIARKWYENHEKHFLKKNTIMTGFREFAFDSSHKYQDVDSGPVIAGYGAAATVFGIGAARVAGRFDQAIPMTKALIVLSWPTPFGFVIPMLGSWLGSRTTVFGEIAILLSMTRRNLAGQYISPANNTPAILWIAFAFFLLMAVYRSVCELRTWKKWLKERKKISSSK